MTRLLRSQSHLVVADPRPHDYRDLAELAAEHQWHVHFLTSGGAAIQFARCQRADLWIVNSRLPDIAGCDLLAMLRELAMGTAVFVVADRYDADDERRACRGGATLFLCKDAHRSINCQPLLAHLFPEENAHDFARPKHPHVVRIRQTPPATASPRGRSGT